MATNKSYLSALPFVADRDSLLIDGGGTINWAAVSNAYRGVPEVTQIVIQDGGATASATTVNVLALDSAIPSGTTLWFGGKKFATLSAPALAGATSLTVEAIPTTIANADTATHVVVVGSGAKFVPAGTPMADGAGTTDMVPANGATTTCLLATNAQEDSHTDALSGYGRIRGGVIYSNLLPVALDGAAITALKQFSLVTYADSTTA